MKKFLFFWFWFLGWVAVVVEFINNNWNVFGDSACHVRLGTALWGSLGGLKGPQRNIWAPPWGWRLAGAGVF